MGFFKGNGALTCPDCGVQQLCGCSICGLILNFYLLFQLTTSALIVEPGLSYMPGFHQLGRVAALFSFVEKSSYLCLTILPHTPNFCALVPGLRYLMEFFPPPPLPVPVPLPGGSH